jgi:hypothetical protein
MSACIPWRTTYTRGNATSTSWRGYLCGGWIVGAICTVHEHDAHQYQCAASISQRVQPGPHPNLVPLERVIIWYGNKLSYSYCLTSLRSRTTQPGSVQFLLVPLKRRMYPITVSMKWSVNLKTMNPYIIFKIVFWDRFWLNLKFFVFCTIGHFNYSRFFSL